MFKGYNPNKKPPYTQDVYYIVGKKIYKTTYTVSRGYADSISVSSRSVVVDTIPENSVVENKHESA